MAVSLFEASQLRVKISVVAALVASSWAANIWEWRGDMDMATQTTYDLSGDLDHSLYWSCADVVGKQDVEDDVTFVQYEDTTGVTLMNRKRSHSDCLMRKSRLPIDLSKIGRIEVDVRASGTSTNAPWYALWLAPMDYSFVEGSVSAEIDLIENRNADTYGHGKNDVHSSFPSCAPYGPEFASSYCKPLHWDVEASDVDHHITMTARQDVADGRVLEIRHCRNAASPMSTCSASDFARIQVSKPNPAAPDWFPIWNETRTGDRFGHYWLVSDIWMTSNSNFKFGITNLRFYMDDGSEWFMPSVDFIADGVHDRVIDAASPVTV